jgi:hypothetical protein
MQSSTEERMAVESDLSAPICRRTKRHGFVSTKRIDTKLGREIIRTYHYSHKTNTAHQYYLGCFINGVLSGVASFGTAMNPNSCSKIVEGTHQKQYLELARLWVKDNVGDNIETVFLALCWRWIRLNLPEVKWVQSFADGRIGVGTVYQASNFVYCGYHVSKFWKDTETGEVFHSSILTRKTRKKYWELQERLDKLTPFNVNTYRYIYIFYR